MSITKSTDVPGRQRRSVITALIVAVCAALAVATPPAAADDRTSTRATSVHRTPTVPIVVDGVRYAPQQIHRFDGRPLYMRVARDGKSLIAYTKLARFKAFLLTKGIRLPARDDANRPFKRMAAGHSTKFCTDRYEQGWCNTINSGMGVANLRALNGCNPWTCWSYDNNIEFVRVNGPGAVLFDLPNFSTGGRGAFYLYTNEVVDLTLYSWGNIVESLYQPW